MNAPRAIELFLGESNFSVRQGSEVRIVKNFDNHHWAKLTSLQQAQDAADWWTFGFGNRRQTKNHQYEICGIGVENGRSRIRTRSACVIS